MVVFCIRNYGGLHAARTEQRSNLFVCRISGGFPRGRGLLKCSALEAFRRAAIKEHLGATLRALQFNLGNHFRGESAPFGPQEQARLAGPTRT
jgi:hypothetical protein